VAPLSAATLAGLPPALVVTAGLDPLRDEGHALAAALRRDGVSVRHRDYGGLFHGFLTILPFAPAQAARTQLWNDMADLLAGSPTEREGRTR
jgi:acetyl esterase